MLGNRFRLFGHSFLLEKLKPPLLIKEMKKLFSAMLVVASLGGGVSPQEGLMEPLEAEIRRAQALKMEGYEIPYFISYHLTDTEQLQIRGGHGSITEESRRRLRYLYPEVHVGSYSLDNFQDDLSYEDLGGYVPVDEGGQGLRHAIWQMTDERYRDAVSDFLTKKAGRAREAVEKDAPSDFSKENPMAHEDPQKTFALHPSMGREMVKRAGIVFSQFADVISSRLTFWEGWGVGYYLNTEGSRIRENQTGSHVLIQANGLAPDGLPVSVSKSFYSETTEGLPSLEVMEKAARELAGEVGALRQAKTMDPYIGPAILDAESCGVLFHEAVGHRLEGERQRDKEEGQTFRGQLGKRIIPEFLSVEDDPTRKEWSGQEISGYYQFDDEGIPAQRVVLVENGLLKNFLLSRRPAEGFFKSNGHGRGDWGKKRMARMANLIVKSSKEVSLKELKQMLLKECERQKKPYGLIIRRMESGDTTTRRGGYQAFRGTPQIVYLVDAKTGKETLVRGVEMVGTPLISINRILAASNDYGVSNKYCGAASGMIPVSTVAPSVLIEQVELQRVQIKSRRPPILPNPFFER